MRDDKPSATAVLIAKSMVFIAGDKRYRSIMPPNMMELSYAFLRPVLSDWKLHCLRSLGRFSLARFLVSIIERLSVPGMIGHYIVRKRRLEDIVAISSRNMNGLQQLVILGAGLDTLGTRTAEANSSIKVFELDHPATSVLKQSAFALGYHINPPNLFLAPVDLSKTTLKDALTNIAGFSFSEKTLFIAEGVFMYLALNDVGKTLDILREFPKEAASFAFTYMLPSVNDGRPAFQGQSQTVDRWLGRKSEPFIWGSNPQDLDAFFNQRGLKAIEHTSAEQLRQAYLVNDAQRQIVTAVGENIAWVEPKN